ncbi:MAG: hypothetical protein QXG09_02600 [Candidatus Bathyarchaeia archaeon]
MPEIDVELVRQLPEPKEGEIYIVEKVEYMETPRGLKGWRATLRNVKDGSLHATVLWKREKVGPKSKLGAFLTVLGSNMTLGLERRSSLHRGSQRIERWRFWE